MSLPESVPLEEVRSGEVGLLLCAASAWQGHPGRCRWCNAELAGRRRRWCSDACSTAWGRNHYWTWASNAAHRRAGGKCERCGARQGAPRRRPGKRRLVWLETHHKTPVQGRHGETGCHHHLASLIVLCIDCHLDEHHSPYSPPLTLEFT